jgi:hypothetical protein
MSRLLDVAIENKKIFPMWVFTDLYNGKYLGKKFVCFIGANFPNGLCSSSEDNHKAAVAALKDGRWLTEMRLANDGKKVGWGSGDNPSLAFREAAYMSGHLTRVET